ncbi:MAG: hypothetical protein RMJ18_00240 [Candidatus Aenigmarchaeota archaeon]|nr:hypothetical protein [Candidatus Aenigmarchaeota archaeon]MCX8190843.1 hypothetical protein [Candidatus Aenigmarchaeota archaeon]MDW8159845.1 hypothetical protein [Candidatus Aenigmarchaeota archaeon]
MEHKILKEKYNPFFKRRELDILITHPNSPTPSKEAVKNLLKEKYNVDDSQIDIRYVISKVGVPESIVRVNIYDEKREVNKVETQSDKNRQESKQ